MTGTPSMNHRWLAALALALGLQIPPAPAAAEMVSIDRAEVNMRAGAGTRYAAQWTLARGYPLRVLGRRDGWLQVRDFEGDTGWVLGRLTAHKPHMVVKVSVANLRSAPGTKHRILGRAKYGEVLRTLSHGEGWVRVRQPGGPTGWVARRLVWGW
jgi:SH3-like domain-containing protein